MGNNSLSQRLKMLLFLVLSTVASSPVAAQEAPVETLQANDFDDAARVLFVRGSEDYTAGRFAAALPRFEQAYDLSERPQLLYNIAVCHDRLDHKAEAATYFERFVEAMPNSPRAEIATARTAVLRTAVAEDAAREERERVAQEQATQAQAQSDAAQRQAEAAERRAAEEQRARERAEQNQSPGSSTIGPAIAFGVAGAGLLTFAIAGGLASAQFNDAKAACELGMCDEDELSSVDERALIADIGLGLAIAGVGVGVLWLLLDTGDDSDDDSNDPAITALRPTVGPTGASLTLQGAF